MSDNTRELFHKLSPERQEEIMDAILAEIAEKTLSGATVRGIAKRLGISHGSLFHYFQSKDGMVDELIKSGYLSQDELFLFRDSDTSTVLEKLMVIIRYSLRIAADNPRLIVFWLEMALPANAGFAEKNIEGELRAIRYIRNLITEGVQTGEFRPDLDIDSAVFAVDNIISGILKAHVSMQEKMKFKEYFGESADRSDDIAASFHRTLSLMLKN